MDYHQKYLKYKTKYNQLKENQNNQIGGLDFGELRAYFLTEEVFKMCIENQVVREEIKKLEKEKKYYINEQEKLTCSNLLKNHESHNISQSTDTSQKKKFYEGIMPKSWSLQRKIKNIDTCKTLNKELEKTEQNINTKNEIKNLYNGTHKRCNFDFYGLDLYATLYGTEKLTFKLQNYAPYCIQGRKELYIPKEKKPQIIDVFNYLIHNDERYFNLNKLLKSTNFQNQNINYMVITRWYRTSPEILICVYIVKKENEEYKFNLILPGEFYAEEPKKCIVVTPRKK